MKLRCLPLVTASVSHLRLNMEFSETGHFLQFVLQSGTTPSMPQHLAGFIVAVRFAVLVLQLLVGPNCLQEFNLAPQQNPAL